jgi:MFS family permease
LPPAVRSLGWVSFANDLASEMVTPLIPLLVVGPLGGTAVLVGLIEGVAEAASQGLKPLVGTWADRHGNHRSLAVGGYLVSNLARPLIGLAPDWLPVFGLRTVDRVGKGLRTAPRDALLAEAAPPELRGRAFGYHRSMDHLGAAVGPLLAVGLLAAGVPIAQVILWSVVPGALTLFLIWRAPLPRIEPRPAPAARAPSLDRRGRRLVLAASVLAFANLPEAFMVVWAHQAGGSVVEIAALWAAVHLLKVGVAYPAGWCADAFGRERVVLVGWCGRALTLGSAALLAAEATMPSLATVFAAYGIALAASEGAERALIAAAAPSGRRGAAFGWYAALPGLAALPGALVVGMLWDRGGPTLAFAVACALALLAATLLLRRASATGA